MSKLNHFRTTPLHVWIGDKSYTKEDFINHFIYQCAKRKIKMFTLAKEFNVSHTNCCGIINFLSYHGVDPEFINDATIDYHMQKSDLIKSHKTGTQCIDGYSDILEMSWIKR